MESNHVQNEKQELNDLEIKNKINDIAENKKKDKFKLKGKIKKFDEKLYNKYDLPARLIMKEKLGDLIKDNSDIYAEDMILEDEQCEYKYIELQVCASWTNDKYPFNYPFVYERKGHFSDKTLFIIFDRHMTKGLIFGKNLLNSEPKRIQKYSRIFIYEVGWKNVLPFCTENLDIDVLRSY